MSWISKNLTLDLLAIAIDGLTKSFDRIKSEPESDWPPVEQAAPAQVEPATPAAQAKQPAVQEHSAVTTEEPTQPQETAAPVPAEAPQPTVDRRPEAQAHLRDISLAGGMEWITGELFPSFGAQSLDAIPDEKLPQLIEKAAAYKLEKGLAQ